MLSQVNEPDNENEECITGMYHEGKDHRDVNAGRSTTLRTQTHTHTEGHGPQHNQRSKTLTHEPELGDTIYIRHRYQTRGARSKT